MLGLDAYMHSPQIGILDVPGHSLWPTGARDTAQTVPRRGNENLHVGEGSKRGSGA